MHVCVRACLFVVVSARVLCHGALFSTPQSLPAAPPNRAHRPRPTAHPCCTPGSLHACNTHLFTPHTQAALYAQAADFNKTARFYYMKAQDAYYLANAQASYDDWRRARRQWDYFYRRK